MNTIKALKVHYGVSFISMLCLLACPNVVNAQTAYQAADLGVDKDYLLIKDFRMLTEASHLMGLLGDEENSGDALKSLVLTGNGALAISLILEYSGKQLLNAISLRRNLLSKRFLANMSQVSHMELKRELLINKTSIIKSEAERQFALRRTSTSVIRSFFKAKFPNMSHEEFQVILNRTYSRDAYFQNVLHKMQDEVRAMEKSIQDLNRLIVETRELTVKSGVRYAAYNGSLIKNVSSRLVALGSIASEFYLLFIPAIAMAPTDTLDEQVYQSPEKILTIDENSPEGFELIKRILNHRQGKTREKIATTSFMLSQMLAVEDQRQELIPFIENNRLEGQDPEHEIIVHYMRQGPTENSPGFLGGLVYRYHDFGEGTIKGTSLDLFEECTHDEVKTTWDHVRIDNPNHAALRAFDTKSILKNALGEIYFAPNELTETDLTVCGEKRGTVRIWIGDRKEYPYVQVSYTIDDGGKSKKFIGL